MSFQELFAEVTANNEHFGHRQHVHLTWLAVRRYGTEEAIAVVSDGIRQTARYAGAPQKYHATVSRAWVEAVGYHAAQHSDDAGGDADGAGNDDTDRDAKGCADDGFAAFAEAHPALLDKRLLSRFYSSALLASAAARTGWVEPDREPFPWQQKVPPPTDIVGGGTGAAQRTGAA